MSSLVSCSSHGVSDSRLLYFSYSLAVARLSVFCFSSLLCGALVCDCGVPGHELSFLVKHGL